MGSNQKGGRGYFPTDAPVEWSYTDAFNSHPNRGFITVGGKAKGKLDGPRVSGHKNAWSNSVIIDQLEVIRSAAEREEQAFLAKYKINIGNGGWGDLIKAFTLIFSTEEAFKRNLQILKQVNDKDDESTKIYHHFTEYMSSYVQRAARKMIGARIGSLIHASFPAILQSLTDEIMRTALEDMFKMTDKVDAKGRIEQHHGRQQKVEGKEIQVFKDLLALINKMMATPFKQLVIDELGLTENFIKNTLKTMNYNVNKKKGQKNKKLPQLKSSITNGKIRGNILEYFEEFIGSEVGKKLDNIVIGSNWMTMRLGPYGVKTDVMNYNLLGAAQGTISLLHNNTGDSDSKRVNSIVNNQRFFDLVRQAEGEIMFISDKNYQIKASGFGGFSAQDKVPIKYLGELFDTIGLTADVDSLIDYLANCGQGMLFGTGTTSEILSIVATQIGHFLFDDLTVTNTGGINRVHLLNLSGFYVPLSVYMGAVIQAARSSEQHMQQYVNTKFTGAGALPPKGGWPGGTGDFESFRQRRLNESYISIFFMKDVANFITKNVHF